MTPDPDPSSITAALSSDHRSITELLADNRIGAPGDEGAPAREQLVSELVRHFVAEELYLFPAVQAHVPDGEAIVDAEFARDRTCEKHLRLLEDEDLDAGGLAAAIAAVRTVFDAHVSEQRGIFTALELACDSAQLAEWGDGVLGAEQLAPTRPRLIAPESVTVNKITSFFAGYIDQVRDHYSRRGIPDELG